MQISLLGKILDLLFPRYCLICGSRLQGSEEMLCTSCISTLPRTDTWKNPYENEMAKIFWAHIPKEISDPIFEEIEDDMYTETLLPLMKSKYKSIKAKNDYERSMKLIRFALGRGYSMDVIHKCIDKMKEEDLGEE